MAEIVKVKPDRIKVDKDSWQDYIDVLNGISWDIQHGGFQEGYRNQTAVDLTVASYMLGLDAEQILYKFFVLDLIKYNDDDEDTFDRICRVLEYASRFDWDYMIDPDTYLTLNDQREEKDMKIIFVFDED